LFIFKKSCLSARTTTPKKFLLLFYQLSIVERQLFELRITEFLSDILLFYKIITASFMSDA